MKNLFLLFLISFFGSIALAQVDGEPYSHWQQDGPLTPNFNNQTFRGWVDAICVNSKNTNEMLIATRTSGIFRTENKGENWVCVTDSLSKTFPVLGCRAMISLPSDPKRVIAITGNEEIAGGVIYSLDFGRTWQACQQDLPTFRWIDFHPSRPNLLFACSDKEVFYSLNKGISWASIGAPPDTDFAYNEMFKLLVTERKISLISKARWDAEAFLHECTFGFSKKGTRLRSMKWSTNLASDYLDVEDDKIMFMDFSNRAGQIHYFQFESKKKIKKTFQTSDGGLSYSPISLPNFPVGHWWKNELIASPNDSNMVYWGQVYVMNRYNKSTGKLSSIKNDSIHPGHHDDYRSSHVISLMGADYLVLGHDGGVGIVKNGLAESPTITNANGDLSINLIHAFDVHEKTGRIVFAYQDGPMFYRNADGTFSEQFIWEGSAAMIQKEYPDEIIGENAYGGIMDKDERIRPIVNGVFGRGGCFLGGYFITYHHYPNRFARGLRNGKVAMNRDVNVSEISVIPNTTSDVGALAVCARHPEFMYAATIRPDNGVHKLHRSTDDGKTWENLTKSTVVIAGETLDLNTNLHWKYIKSIAVDPDDGKTVFCGIARPYDYFGEVIQERFRVIKSVDGGLSFIDYSEGLPHLPVDELLAVESDDGLLFCANMYGVFYRTKAMDRWEPFSNHLPKVEFTGLKYDYCNNVLYASTYGRGLWKTKVGFEVINSHQEVISTNTVWDTNRILCDHVLVKSGVTLTITANIEKYKNKEIVVEPGGKLILDGGSIGEFCDCEGAK
jgi:hypothetical protein